MLYPRIPYVLGSQIRICLPVVSTVRKRIVKFSSYINTIHQIINGFLFQITQFVEINVQSNLYHPRSALKTESLKSRSCLINSSSRRWFCSDTVVQQPQPPQSILQKVLKKVGLAENSKSVS